MNLAHCAGMLVTDRGDNGCSSGLCQGPAWSFPEKGWIDAQKSASISL